MRGLFIETPPFSRMIKAVPEGGIVKRELENLILQEPQRGDLIPGACGVRKLRLGAGSRGKGKRGGYRIIYLDLAELEECYLLAIYGKDKKIDLTPTDKKRICELVKILKKEA